jgi:hypothetical protein
MRHDIVSSYILKSTRHCHVLAICLLVGVRCKNTSLCELGLHPASTANDTRGETGFAEWKVTDLTTRNNHLTYRRLSFTVLFQPTFYHLSRVILRIFARCKNLIRRHLAIVRVNSHAILPPLNPRADCVSYPPILHQINLALNWNTRMVGTTSGGLRRISQSCRSCLIENKKSDVCPFRRSPSFVGATQAQRKPGPLYSTQCR